MSYDSEGRLSSWTAPGAPTSNDQFLYDNAGNRVLQRTSTGSGNPTDTITFDNYTDVAINGGQTSTTKYYTANGQRIAMRQDGILSYLVPDLLGSVSLTLYADGSTESVQFSMYVLCPIPLPLIRVGIEPSFIIDQGPCGYKYQPEIPKTWAPTLKGNERNNRNGQSRTSTDF